jgi:uncharacterized metal-binding protein
VFRRHVQRGHADGPRRHGGGETRRAGPGRAAIFCLGGLPTAAPTVLEKTAKVGRIIVVDGCPLSCARKIVEQAGFHPDAAITLVDDCGIKKGPPTQYTPDDLEVAVSAILAAVDAEARG